MLQKLLEGLLARIGVGDTAQEALSVALLVLLLALFAYIVGWLLQRIFVPILLKVVSKTPSKLDDYLLSPRLLTLACHVVPGPVFLGLYPYTFEASAYTDYPVAFALIGKAVGIYTTACFLIALYALVDNVSRLFQEAPKWRERHFRGIFQAVKIVFGFLGAIVVVGIIFDKSPFTLIAGLGAAATVLSLVFKDSLVGLVAGIQISAFKMMKPGDWVTVDSLGIDGTVEEISLVTVKIRNFDNTISTVPPSTLMSGSFQNWASVFETDARRFKRALYIDQNSVRPATAEEKAALFEAGLIVADEKADAHVINLTLFRHSVERMLRSREDIRQDMWLLVRQLAPTTQGLPVELFFYFNRTDFEDYEELCARLVEQLLAQLPLFGLRVFQTPAGTDVQALSASRGPL